MNKCQLCWTWSKVRVKKINDDDKKEPEGQYIDKKNRIIGLKFPEPVYPVHKGTLFVKCVLNGSETFETEKGTFSVDENNYLILNDECNYSSRITSLNAESFCISFDKSFVGEVGRSIMLPCEKLLDEPEGPSIYPEFNEKLYSHDETIKELINNLKTTFNTEAKLTQSYLEEMFYKLLERILILNLDNNKAEGISTLKKVPRIEILKRLNVARDFMHSNIDWQVDLKEISENANLSTFHFLRLFKEVFGETPHQYLIRNRLEKARKLLLNTGLSVTDISLEIGFESLSHFTRLFTRHFGTSPKRFRTGKNKILTEEFVF